jgi:hypothetical protein
MSANRAYCVVCAVNAEEGKPKRSNARHMVRTLEKETQNDTLGLFATDTIRARY